MLTDADGLATAAHSIQTSLAACLHPPPNIPMVTSETQVSFCSSWLAWPSAAAQNPQMGVLRAAQISMLHLVQAMLMILAAN